MCHDDGGTDRYARNLYLRAHQRERVTLDPLGCVHRSPTPYTDAGRPGAWIEPPVGEYRIQSGRGQAINFLRGQFLEGKDIGLLASRSHERVWIRPPFKEVR